SPRPETPTSDRAEATRRHILDFAAGALAEHGYRGISLNDIVRASGLTKGAFYFHFPSKEALALAVFRDRQEQWVARTMEALQTKPTAFERLDAILDVGASVYETDPSARVVGRLCTEMSPHPELASHLEVWFELIADRIRQGQAEGDIRADVDPQTTAETLAAAFIGIEQVSGALSGLTDIRRRIEGLRALVRAALERSA
ncbi:MAG: TetR family transcriptional regulator, partial [Gaiellaceae bacterium]